jgi:hypothetical protein
MNRSTESGPAAPATLQPGPTGDQEMDISTPTHIQLALAREEPIGRAIARATGRPTGG